MHEHNSEIARLRNQIALEYQATNRLFTDFTSTARHAFITKRQERIGACFEELQCYVTPEEAAAIVALAATDAYGASASSGNTS